LRCSRPCQKEKGVAAWASEARSCRGRRHDQQIHVHEHVADCVGQSGARLDRLTRCHCGAVQCQVQRENAPRLAKKAIRVIWTLGAVPRVAADVGRRVRVGWATVRGMAPGLVGSAWDGEMDERQQYRGCYADYSDGSVAYVPASSLRGARGG